MSLILSQNQLNINTNIQDILPVPNNHPFWETNFANFSVAFIQNLFVQYLQDIDEQFFSSQERIRSYYSKDKQTRTLVTIFGTITFSRRRYVHKDTKRSFHYIDYLLGIDKYQRATNQVQAAILHSISFEHDSYRKATQPFGLSKTYAYHLIKKLVSEHYAPYLDTPISCPYLHLVADEDHVAIQDKKRIRKKDSTNIHMVRHVSIFTNITHVCKGRNRLENRIILSQFEKETVQEFSQRVNEFILHNYRVEKEVYVYGDGASWIQTLTNETCGKFILDKFHMKQAMYRVCGGKTNEPIRQVLQRYLELNNKEMFNLVAKTLYPQMTNYKQKHLQYMNNFWEAYQNNFKIPAALWCCAEGINSHYFAEYYSSRPKGFSISNMHKIGYLLSLSHSQKDIRNYYIEHIEEFIEHKEKTEYTKQDRKYLEMFTNMPVIQRGKLAGIYNKLHSLAH